MAAISLKLTGTCGGEGRSQALADADPLTFLWLKEGKLNELATNLSGEYASRTCCVLAIRGSLIAKKFIMFNNWKNFI